MDFLNQELLLGFTVREIALAALVIWILWGVLKKVLPQKANKSQLVKKKCRGCNWTGPAGDDTKRCPKCRGPLIAV